MLILNGDAYLCFLCARSMEGELDSSSIGAHKNCQQCRSTVTVHPITSFTFPDYISIEHPGEHKIWKGGRWQMKGPTR